MMPLGRAQNSAREVVAHGRQERWRSSMEEQRSMADVARAVSVDQMRSTLAQLQADDPVRYAEVLAAYRDLGERLRMEPTGELTTGLYSIMPALVDFACEVAAE